NPQPSTLNPQPSTLNPQPAILNPQPSTLNPQPSTLNPQPSTLNPQPSTPQSITCSSSAATLGRSMLYRTFLVPKREGERKPLFVHSILRRNARNVENAPCIPCCETTGREKDLCWFTSSFAATPQRS
ncbi:hypothetical protein T484DRAFT_1640793, partial [Baffinella frigidus]